MNAITRHFLSVFIVSGWAATSAASELVYTPVNPSFGGSPLNSTQLFNEANAQKPNAPVKPYAKQSTADQFLQMLQSRLYSSLAQTVGDAIVGKGAQDSGKIKLDTLEVSWSSTGDQTKITLNDFSTGKITDISVPRVTQ